MQKIFFDDAIFQRVEGDHCESASDVEAGYGLRERFRHRRQLVVHRDPQRLESFRRRVETIPFTGGNGFDDCDQLARRMKRSGFHDGSREFARVAFFAVFVQHIR